MSQPACVCVIVGILYGAPKVKANRNRTTSSKPPSMPDSSRPSASTANVPRNHTTETISFEKISSVVETGSVNIR